MSHRSIFLNAVILLIFCVFCLSAHNLSANDTEILFSPKNECGNIILDKINQAKESIELAMYHFTSRVLSRALVDAVKRGVKVRVYLDGENARERYSKARYLEKNGVLVKLEKGEGLMHNKFCIIDDALVITGSYNWTTSADLQNDENVIFIRSKELSRAYRIQFEEYWRGEYLDKAYYLNKNTLQKISPK